ncbi:MAG: tRNA (N6-isopentenyl adenosine(37)-C2)-methylthiotransferase MiaB [Chthonomonadales bacterium]|nr:tRNA (N6-isopentenyl adenosine(37)-C2)-methylthiotransferase MiaB [Chthonomonadales bacterium]
MPEHPPTFHITTWGCQMNEEDSEQMALSMEQMGYERAPNAESADVVLLNTCSVRRKPEEKVYSRLGELRELKQQRPELIVGVCGCMAQVESAGIRRRAPFVDLILGTGNVGALPALIRSARERRAAGGGASVEHAVAALELPARKGAVVTDVPLRSLARRPKLKAFVPIMYGCDKFCTFCIVPNTRGRERSRPADEIVGEAEGLARAGTREVTLLGQTVNSYGKNLADGRVPFARLLERLDAVRGLRRIRFTSPYARDFTDELVETIARLGTVCEHVHLPLQVADDDLLRRMRRGYTVAEYARVLEKLRSSVPGIAVTTDLMLGFPGETDEQFRNTLRFVEEARFDAAFMFAYSMRPGTRAAEMANQVPHEVKIARLRELIELQNGITVARNRALVGAELEVLVEGRSPRDPTRMTGLTRTFKTVNFAADDRHTGKLVAVRLVEAHLTGFTGELAR